MPDDIGLQPEPAERSAEAREPPGVGPDGLPDTPVPNPLNVITRHLVATWLQAVARGFEDELERPPPPEEVAQCDGDEDLWRERVRVGCARLRANAAAITADVLAFAVAGDIRNLLEHAPEHELKAAAAALEATVSDHVPLRAMSLRQESAQRKKTDGFQVTHVGGRGEPLALPAFTYTDGLADHDHPELAIVGIEPRLAGTLLTSLATEIVAGERTISVDEDIDGQLHGGYQLRVIRAPAALVAALAIADGADALQILIPDQDGLFPGDDGVDAELGQGQHYPERRDLLG